MVLHRILVSSALSPFGSLNSSVTSFHSQHSVQCRRVKDTASYEVGPNPEDTYQRLSLGGEVLRTKPWRTKTEGSTGPFGSVAGPLEAGTREGQFL
jgi:hypothetical protein